MTTLITIENISLENAPSVFKQDGLKPFIEHIRGQVTGEVPDLSTKKGRDRIASLAAQVSRSKTAVEKPGRDYLKHLKELPKTIEAELREFVRECDALRDEVRKPLTEWENAEKARVDGHRAKIDDITSMPEYANSPVWQSKLDTLNGLELGDWCEEYLAQYTEAKKAAIATAKDRLTNALEAEKQQAELEELRRLQAEREQAEREARLIAEAEQRAKAQAEAAAKAERDAAERAERERTLEAERREMQLKLQAEQAERQRAEAEQRAVQAAENERKRIEAEQARLAAEEAARAANVAHRKAVNNATAKALQAQGLTEAQAKSVVIAVAKGLVAGMAMEY
jgi:hypothetical protein